MFLTEIVGHTGTKVSGALGQRKPLMNLLSKLSNQFMMRLPLVQLKLELQSSVVMLLPKILTRTQRSLQLKTDKQKAV